jgi:hypothetical protein
LTPGVTAFGGQTALLGRLTGSASDVPGTHGSLDAISNSQLPEYLLDVLVDSVRGNVEAMRNLAVGESSLEVAKDLVLAQR